MLTLIILTLLNPNINTNIFINVRDYAIVLLILGFIH